VLLRQVNTAFETDWRRFHESGLYEALVRDGLTIPFEVLPDDPGLGGELLCVIRPRPVPFISYPYEWCFGELKDAALITLRVQDAAMDRGMTLRDASAFNIQFLDGRPVLIDSLSLGVLEPGRPWVAYRQFCEQFLAPLALMAHRDVRLAALTAVNLDGVPLDLAARLLPRRTVLDPGLAAHIHAHGRAQRGASGRTEAARRARVSETGLRALVDSLRRTIEALRWEPRGTTWADYADQDGYADAARASKAALVEGALRAAGGEVVWDLGANTGVYSRIAADLGRRVVAFDNDPAAVERAWRAIRTESETRILPLLVDVASPTPSLGWAGAERRSLLERADADVVMALALVHHLAIGRNVPLPRITDLLADLAPWAIVEFVPREDPMAGVLLSTREDIFTDYDLEGFRRATERRFTVEADGPIEGSARRLFLLRRR
jgi:hypothetical protein